MAIATTPITRDRSRVGKPHAADTGLGPAPVVTLDELRVAAQALVNDGWSPAEAARGALLRLAPDADAARQLVEIGLAQLVNNDLGHRRETAGPKARPAVAIAILPPGADGRGVDPLDIPAQKSDGTMAPLRAWTVADWSGWAAYCETQADGWFRRQEGSREIADLLRKAKVERIADLPLPQQEKARGIVRGFRV